MPVLESAIDSISDSYATSFATLQDVRQNKDDMISMSDNVAHDFDLFIN